MARIGTQSPKLEPIIDEPIEAPRDQAITIVEANARGEIDTQITTAKRYPRQIRKFIDDVRSLVTLNEEVAAACTYSLPRYDAKAGGMKSIEGPSVRFAEAVASCWGAMRAGSFIVQEEERFIVVRGFAWDMEKNNFACFDVRRRITGKGEKRYNDDMIGVTGMAAGSIAYRNAVLKVVPSAIWKPIWQEARQTALGDAKTLVSRRAVAFEYLQKFGVGIDRILFALDCKGPEDIDLDRLATLRSMITSIKEDGLEVDVVFPPVETSKPDKTQSSLADRLKEKTGQKPADEPANPDPAPKEKPTTEETSSTPATPPDTVGGQEAGQTKVTPPLAGTKVRVNLKN